MTSVLPVSDRDAITARYRARWAEHGPSVAALASGDAAKQAIRHGILAGIGPLEDASVLDVGCGLGHFYQHCRDAGLSISYTGIDLVPEFVAHCQAAYGADLPRPEFITADLFNPETVWPGPMDYVIASQVFNNRYEGADNWDLFETAVRGMYAHCGVGVAVDCLTTRVDFQESRLYYFDPARVLALGLSLTRRAVLRHDYPLYEQTLYLYRE